MNEAKEVAEKNEFNRELCHFALARTSPLSMSTSCYLIFFSFRNYQPRYKSSKFVAFNFKIKTRCHSTP